QQPLRFRGRERETQAGVRLAKARGFVEHRQKLPAIFPALCGERFFEQSLVFPMGRAFVVFAELMVRGRNERVQLQDLKQQALLPFANAERETIRVHANDFHDSRSMVAWRVSFWSWCA